MNFTSKEVFGARQARGKTNRPSDVRRQRGLLRLENSFEYAEVSVDWSGLQVCDVKTKNLRDERIYVHVFKRLQRDSRLDVRSGCNEDGLHLRHASCVKPVHAPGGDRMPLSSAVA